MGTIDMKLQVVQTARLKEFTQLADGVTSKELGLSRATRGLFTARRVKASGAWTLGELASLDRGARFSFLYVLNGWIGLRAAKGTVTLHAHDAITQAVLGKDSLLEASPELEFIEFQAPDTDRVRKYLPEWPRQAIALDSPDVHIVGTGPRNFFDYRDLGVAQSTGRRLEVQVVRAQRAREGGTGWHSHDMAQLTYGLSGWASLGVEGRSEPVMKERGDALCIPAHCIHNAAAFSDDYWALQLQIPADYDTVARSAPVAG